MGKTLSLEYPIYKRTPRKSYVNRVKEQIRCRDAYTLGLTGRGVCVAVLDTGAYPHRDFEDRISGFADVVNHRPGPYDDCGHGTHICGIIGGSGAVSDGRYQGMPQAVPWRLSRSWTGRGTALPPTFWLGSAGSWTGRTSWGSGS